MVFVVSGNLAFSLAKQPSSPEGDSIFFSMSNALVKREVSNHRFSCICYQFGTFESIRTGSIPKKGLIGIEGKISASGADGRGVIHIPPVSGKPHLFMNTFSTTGVISSEIMK